MYYKLKAKWQHQKSWKIEIGTCRTDPEPVSCWNWSSHGNLSVLLPRLLQPPLPRLWPASCVPAASASVDRASAKVSRNWVSELHRLRSIKKDFIRTFFKCYESYAHFCMDWKCPEYSFDGIITQCIARSASISASSTPREGAENLRFSLSLFQTF